MIRWLTAAWRGSDPVKFESSFGLTESVERLRAATRHSAFAVLAQQEAVGTVEVARVSLQRAIPMVRNSFKPYFNGRFVMQHNRVVLVGRFTLHGLVKVFMAFWFGATACFTVLTAITSFVGPGKAWQGPIFGLAMMGAGVAMVALGRWFARNDAAWLSDVINRALHDSPPVQPTQPTHATSNTRSSVRPPLAVAIASGLLAVLGLACCSSVLSNIQSIHSSVGGLVMTDYPAGLSRYFVFGYGMAVLVLAYGVYRQRMMAWRAGLVFLVVGWVYTVFEMLATNGLSKNGAMVIVFSIASLVVTIFWCRWWYAQRVHFHD